MDISEEFTEKELSIDNSSVFTLERELLAHSKKEAKYHRWWAAAIKDVDRLTLDLEIVSAEIVQENLMKAEKEGKPLSASAEDNLKKSVLPLDKRYKMIKRRLMGAKETANILAGLVKAWEGRGYRLKELVTLAEYVMLPEPRVFKKDGGEAKYGSDLEDRLDSAGSKLED